MQIGNFSLWTSKAKAAEYGCTHHASLFGMVPGFFGETDGMPLWVPRSDALNWLEDLLSHISVAIQQSKGEEPLFAFKVGKPL